MITDAWHIGNRPIGLFLGSGASLPYPSELPTFRHILNGWTPLLSEFLNGLPQINNKNIQIAEIVDMIKKMPPEAIFQVIDSCRRVQLQNAIIAVLAKGEPNATHCIAADILRNKGVVWTTNYDTLIEQAANLSPTDSSKIAFDQRFDSVFNNDNVRLLKPHGTLSSPDTWVFRSQDVLRPAPSAVEERLRSDIRRYYMIFLGYSASDLDLRPILQEAVEHDGMALWFCLSKGEEESILKLFPKAARESRLSIFRDKDPSEHLWRWAKGQGLIETVPAGTLKTEPNVHPLAQLMEDPEIRAILLRRVGALDIAIYALRPALKRLQYDAIVLYLSINRQQRRILGLAIHFFRAILRAVRRSSRDRGLYSLSYMAFESGRYKIAIKIARIDYVHASIERKIQFAASLRMDGRVSEGLSIVEEIINKNKLAPSMHDANLEARVMYVYVICLRWGGRERAAIERIDDMDQRRLKHADTHWEGWLIMEKGISLSLIGEMEKAREASKEALDIFTLRSNPIGLINALALQSALRRFDHKNDEAMEIINRAQNLLLLGAENRITRETIAFENAELLRTKEDYLSAEKSYAVLLRSRSDLLKCHGALGMAELERDRKYYEKAGDWARTALKGYQRLNYKWGQCNAILTLVLSNILTFQQAEDEVAKTEYKLPGETIKSLLFDHSPDHRPLNLL